MITDYEKIAQAIRFINENIRDQPGLEKIAQSTGLSSFHFQRLFRRWVGITPKRFLQFLTVNYAKNLLSESSVLDTALELGLSSQSRLYDHFITLEAVTPGEYKQDGLGLKIEYGTSTSPFGHVFIAATNRGVCQLSFVDDENRGLPLQTLSRIWPNAKIAENRQYINTLVERIFESNSHPKDSVHLLVKGSNFQVKVWESLLRIPSGRVCSYGQIAASIKQPTASRAVANAVGANPVAYLIPCHRVIRNTGLVGGYRWGIERKQAILAWEAAHRENGQSP